jgi:transcription initiation factor TFIIB
VEVICSVLDITKEIQEEAKRIGCQAVGRGLLRKPLPTIAATSIYIACRETGKPVTIDEVALAVHENPTEIGRCYRLLVRRLGIILRPPEEAEYLLRVASKLGLSKSATDLSIEIEKRAIDRGIVGKKPMTLAAAAIYAACKSAGEEKTQWDVADAAGVGVISLRECNRAIRGLVIDAR